MTNATAARPQTGRYRQLPFAPLEAIVCGRIREASAARQAETLGVNPRQIHRWRSYGVNWVNADRLAVRLGMHPGEIWPEWWTMPNAR